ncbi:MAG: hypothetical protein IPP10_15500 [Candidatus Competibacteraceae bacterium]|nr:hypothetical protein [Candidatus Competibacteraceae bacterium]
MTNKYQTWIEEHYPTPESARLHCAEATAAMITKFPELRRVRGHAFIGLSFRTHWWCVASDGTIVDPTAHQWALLPLQYNVIPNDAEEPHGKCYECGVLLFRSKGDDSYYCMGCK